MTNEELVRLAQTSDNPAKYYEELYTQNLGFIRRVVQPYAVTASDLEDLLQEAYFAIVEAAQRFDLSRDVKFSTYAKFWILRSCQEYVRSTSLVSIPVHIVSKISKYKKRLAEFSAEHGRDPTRAELAEVLGCDIAEVERLEVCAAKAVSLNDDSGMIDYLIDGNVNVENEVVETITEEERRGTWQILADNLPERQSNVLYMSFHENMTLAEIGQLLGVSKERSRQIRNEGLRAIRTKKTFSCLRDKYEFANRYMFQGTVGSFQRTWETSTERAALKHLSIEEEIEKYLKSKR